MNNIINLYLNLADVDALSGLKDSLRTALLLASQEGHLSTVKLLVDSGLDLFYYDGDGYSALQWAQIRGHNEVAEMLISSLSIFYKKILSIY